MSGGKVQLSLGSSRETEANFSSTQFDVRHSCYFGVSAARKKGKIAFASVSR